jgi:hypothetical protein
VSGSGGGGGGSGGEPSRYEWSGVRSCVPGQFQVCSWAVSLIGTKLRNSEFIVDNEQPTDRAGGEAKSLGGPQALTQQEQDTATGHRNKTQNTGQRP